jgi:ABC-type phosphate transport system substrate-binding protein
MRPFVSLRRMAAVGAASLALVVALSATAGPAYAGPTINGSGSSFAKPEIDQWRAEVARNPYNLTLNYTAQGSTLGRQQYQAGLVDFAASDIPFTAQELPNLKGDRASFVYVPVSAGGLAFMYNLTDLSGARVTNLNLTRRAACRIFTEPNMKWDDPEIVGANPGLRLPSELVRAILRQDGSGTSYVLSEYCIAVAPDVWAAFKATAQQLQLQVTPEFENGEPVSQWPSGWGVSGTASSADGVAAAVADPSGANSVTYREGGNCCALIRPGPSERYVSTRVQGPRCERVFSVHLQLRHCTDPRIRSGER